MCQLCVHNNNMLTWRPIHSFSHTREKFSGTIPCWVVLSSGSVFIFCISTHLVQYLRECITEMCKMTLADRICETPNNRVHGSILLHLARQCMLTENCRSSHVLPDSSFMLSCANFLLRFLASISVSPHVTDSNTAS